MGYSNQQRDRRFIDSKGWIAIICALITATGSILAAKFSSSSITINTNSGSDATNATFNSTDKADYSATIQNKNFKAPPTTSTPSKSVFDEMNLGTQHSVFDGDSIKAQIAGDLFKLYVGNKKVYSIKVRLIRGVEFHTTRLLPQYFIYFYSHDGVNDYDLGLIPVDKFEFFEFCEKNLLSQNPDIEITDTKSFYDFLGFGWFFIILFWGFVAFIGLGLVGHLFLELERR